MSSRLLVDADLVLETPAGPTRLTGRGSALDLDLPDWGSLLALVRWAGPRAGRLAPLGPLWRRADLDVGLFLRGHRIGSLRPPGSPRQERPRVRVRPGGVLRALLPGRGPGSANGE